MIEYARFDLEAYRERVRKSPCFICSIGEGSDTSHHIVYRDVRAIVFLNKYPTLYGYMLVAPLEHREEVTGDFSLEEYTELQKVVYRAAEALRAELAVERIYILSLGSRQGNSHVHWHVAALPPGVPYEEQQLEALMLGKGYLRIAEGELAALAERLGERMRDVGGK